MQSPWRQTAKNLLTSVMSSFESLKEAKKAQADLMIKLGK